MANRLITLALIALLAVGSSGCVTKLGQHLAGRGCCNAGGPCGCGGEVSCAVEPGCGCEPSCGCGSTCGVNGRSYAGQVFNGCGTCEGPVWCPCKDASGGCGCEPTCGADPGCGVEATCGCEPSCGCGSTCGSTCGCGHNGGCFSGVRYAIGTILSPFFGCNGCGGELYWSEWHNDPPQCCDPCNRCGDWIGPSTQLGSGYSSSPGASGSGFSGGYVQSPGHGLHDLSVASQPTVPATRRR